MNKNDLILAVASESGIYKADAARALDVILDMVTHALRRRDEVRLVGFGTFNVVNRNTKVGRDPRTGAKIIIPASRQPRFKAGKVLKKLLNTHPDLDR